jgi:hypothetical protein
MLPPQPRPRRQREHSCGPKRETAGRKRPNAQQTAQARIARPLLRARRSLEIDAALGIK